MKVPLKLQASATLQHASWTNSPLAEPAGVAHFAETTGEPVTA
ncbi:MAG TPA: hypothetical protein VGL55_13360 [Steroidobacteraceae bacterium]|jgi:hypothetical protein